MKYQGKHWYFYLGSNGLILAVNFDWHKKNRDIQISFSYYSERNGDYDFGKRR